MLNPPVNLVIFDLDGTLAHTAPQIALGVQGALTRNNLPVPGFDRIVGYVGNGADMLLKRAITDCFDFREEDIDPEVFAKVKKDYLECYMKEIGGNFQLYPGVRETLQALKEQDFKLAIATNKPDCYLKPWLQAAELLSVFDIAVGSGVVPFNKPDPAILLHICTALGVAPCNALMVGDSCNDILGARNAGMRSVGLTYGYNYLRPLQDYQPDYVFDHFNELKNLLIG